MAFRWLCNARKNLQQGTLPRSVATDDSDNFTAPYFKRNLVERPDGFGMTGDRRRMTVSRWLTADRRRATGTVAFFGPRSAVCRLRSSLQRRSETTERSCRRVGQHVAQS